MSRRRQYMWVDQEFYNLMMGKAKELKNKGFPTGTADLTQRIAPLLKQNLQFENLFPKVRWRKRKSR